jgi:hypothetical protein
MSDFIQSGSFRRILVGVMTSLALLLHKKLGIEVEPEALVSIAVLAAVYITGGNIKEAALTKGAEAAAKPSTIEQDAALLGGKVEERK